jgi:hypothetical protein
MHLPAAGPRQLRDLAADGFDTARRVLPLLPRVDSLLDTAQLLLDRAALLLLRIARTEAAAHTLVADLEATHQQIRTLIDRHGTDSARLVAALQDSLPTLDVLRPAIERLAETWGRPTSTRSPPRCAQARASPSRSTSRSSPRWTR